MSLREKRDVDRRSAVRHFDRRRRLVLHLRRFSGKSPCRWRNRRARDFYYFKHKNAPLSRPNGCRWPLNRGRPSTWCTRYPSTAGPTKDSNTWPSIRSKTTWCADIGWSTSTPAFSSRPSWSGRARWTSITIRIARGCWIPTSSVIWP